MKKRVWNFINNIVSIGNSIVQLSKEGLAYLSEETDMQILVSNIRKVNNNRMNRIISSLKKQYSTAIGNFQRHSLIIEYNPEYMLFVKEVEMLNSKFSQRDLFDKEIKRGLISNLL